MKKVFALLMAALLLLGAGCSRDMNWVISNEPSVWGVVEEIGDEWILLRVTRADNGGVAVGALVRAERATRLQDCKFSAQVGDEVAVYYDSDTSLVLGAVPEIHEVHGYTLVVPVQRESEEG